MAQYYGNYDDMDDDSDDRYNNPDFDDYAGADALGPAFNQNNNFNKPATSYGGGYSGGSDFRAKPRDPLSGGIGYGQASNFGGIGDNSNSIGYPGGRNFGGAGPINTDYVDLRNVKAPDVQTHQPNKFATSSRSSLKKPGKKIDPRGVSFGENTIHHVDKESQLTETDKKSKSEDNDDSNSDEDEDEIENKALAKNIAATKKKEEKPGSIAAMFKKMQNIEESITESGSMGLKKSIDSEDYKVSNSHDNLPKKKELGKKHKSPTGLSDSDDMFHHKSQDLDSNKKLSSEYDSAELSRNFNIEESEDTFKNKPKSDKSKKSEEKHSEYEDDFEASSNLYESSQMSKSKHSHSKDKHDEIEEIRKRNMEYKSNLDSFKSTFKTQDEHEDEISKRLDSYRAKDEIQEEPDSDSPRNSSGAKRTSNGLRDSKMSQEEAKLAAYLRRSNDAKAQSLESLNKDLAREKFDYEINAKQFEMDAEVSKMEARNAVETNKLLKERILGYIQDINVYRVEIEGLKRQVDIADANAKSKEDEVNQITHEYESQIKLERERNVNSNVRQEAREITDLKKEIRLLKAAHDQEARDKFEEIDYLTKRCDKLESENVALRVGSKAVRDAENKSKKFEDEVHSLRMRLKEQMKSKEALPTAGSSYNHWSKEQLVKELMSIDNAIERFTKENEALMHENNKQRLEIQELNSMLYKESKKLEDYRHKIVKETGSVMIVENDKDLHAKIMNDLGVEHAITLKEFNEIKENLFKMQKLNADQKQEFMIKEIDYKSEIEKIRAQRVESERKMIGLDSALKTQLSTNEKYKEDYHNALTKLQDEKDEIQQKLDWYMENQEIIGKDDILLKQRDERISALKEEIREIKTKDGGRKRITELEKQVKDLQDALKKKNPDSIPLMLESVKPSIEEQDAYRKLMQENEKLKKTLQDKDDEFDKKIRNLRLEVDKMKTKYDKSKSTPIPEDAKDKRIQDLERQVDETKQYYQDRVKKIQESKEGPGKVDSLKNELKHVKEIEVLKKELDSTNKAKKKLETELRATKGKPSKNTTPDLVLAINALLEEDYVF